MSGGRSRVRRGVTLPGMLIGITLSALVLALLGSAMVTLLRQAHRQHDRTQARAQLAQAAGVLAAELRGATSSPSPTDVADLLLVADSAVEVRAAVGGGAACAVGASAIELPDPPAVGGPPVAWWSDAPQPDDVLHVHDEGPTPAIADDAWLARTIAAVDRGGSACAGGPFVSAGGSTVRLQLDGAPLPTTVSAGAPVRVTRRRRYVLYRAGDGTWQLGQRSWQGGVASLQPLAGALAPYAGPDVGMTVRAVDVDGVSVDGAPPARAAARLSIVVRAERAWAGRRWLDSAAAHVALDRGTSP